MDGMSELSLRRNQRLRTLQLARVFSETLSRRSTSEKIGFKSIFNEEQHEEFVLVLSVDHLAIISDSTPTGDHESVTTKKLRGLEEFWLPLNQLADVHFISNTVHISYHPNQQETQTAGENDFTSLKRIRSLFSPNSRNRETLHHEGVPGVKRMLLHTRTPSEAYDLAEAISTTTKRLIEALLFLDKGLPVSSDMNVYMVTAEYSLRGGTSTEVVLKKGLKWGSQVTISSEVMENIMWSPLSVIRMYISSPLGPQVASLHGPDLHQKTGHVVVEAVPVEQSSVEVQIARAFHVQVSLHLVWNTSVVVREPIPLKNVNWGQSRIFFVAVAVGLGCIWQSPFLLAATLACLFILAFTLFPKKSSSIETLTLGLTAGDIVEAVDPPPSMSLSASLRSPSLIDLGSPTLSRQSILEADIEEKVDGVSARSKATLTADEAAAVSQLRKLSVGITKDLLLRYIAASKGNRQKAIDRLKLTAEWRAENAIDSVLRRPLRPFRDVKESYRHGLLGMSKKDHMPVFIEAAGTFRLAVREMKSRGVTSSDMIDHFIFIMEYILTVVNPTPMPNGKFIRVFDMKGMSLTDLTDKEGMELGKQMCSVMEHHYPERLKQAILFNIPAWWSAVWKIISPMLDPNTHRKLKVCSNPSALTKALKEHLEDDEIPQDLGGHRVSSGWNDSALDCQLQDFVDKLNSSTATDTLTN